MAEIITFLLVVAAIIAVVGYFTFRDMTTMQQQDAAEDAEYEAFEQHRAERQAVFDQHAQEVAHRVLIDTCETIYIGRWQND